MRHKITTPSGEVYAEVWREDGRLRLILMKYLPNVQIIMDEKVIPQLIDALKSIQQESA